MASVVRWQDGYNGCVLEGPSFLSADQSLLTTLIVKLAVMAVLATMLARFRRFRHILIFERRVWTDRLVFALALGVPLMAGVTARLLLNYQATDLTLEGAFLAGLIAGLAYGLLYQRTGNLRAAIASHASTNLTIAGWILATGEWRHW